MNVIKGETIQGEMLGLFRRIFVPCRVINGGEERVSRGERDGFFTRQDSPQRENVRKKMQTTDNT